MLGQFVDHPDPRQFGRQRLAFATALDRGDAVFGLGDLLCFGFNGRRRLFGQLLGFVEHRQLRRVRIDTALGFRAEQALTQQGDLLLKLFYASILCRHLLVRRQQ